MFQIFMLLILHLLALSILFWLRHFFFDAFFDFTYYCSTILIIMLTQITAVVCSDDAGILEA